MKTNRFLLAVACATMAFTFFACSDDKDETDAFTPKGACYISSVPVEAISQLCIEFGQSYDISINQTLCQQFNDERIGGQSVSVQESGACPKDHTDECSNPEKDIVFYLYGGKCADLRQIPTPTPNPPQPPNSYRAGACYAASTPIPGVQMCVRFSSGFHPEMELSVICEHVGDSDVSLVYRESCEQNPSLTCLKEEYVFYLYGTLPAEFDCSVF